MAKKNSIFRLPKAISSPQKNIGELGSYTEETIDKHFFRRLTNLAKVRRFVIGWLLLMSLILLVGVLQIGMLRAKYQKLYYEPGGTFTEGIVGTYSNADPIYASSSVDSSVSKLIFSGLYKYDSNQKLVPDLASGMSIDKRGRSYTVTLKDNLYWHDGQRLTAKDVVFTFKTIQNPDAKSYLLSSWQGIKISQKDDKTAVFTLPSTLSSFPDSLTTGIIPWHILKDIPAQQLRSSDFNTVHPVGSGPFKYDTVEVQPDSDKSGATLQHIGFLANDGYYGGSPGIKRYIINTYNNQNELTRAYDSKKVDAISGLGTIDEQYSEDQDNNVYSVPIAGQTMVFFNNSQDILSDPKVRRALVLGANRQKIIQSTGQVLKQSDEPLLVSQLGYNKKFAQQTNDTELADKILNKAGWKIDSKTGIRTKKRRRLSIKLFALSNNEYGKVANELRNEWADLGIDTRIVTQSDENLKDTVSNHGYDALLTTISVGADPDVFAFWHSSQISAKSKARLNFSEYKSSRADISLEAGRSRLDPKIRAVKYKGFLKAWHNDNPALALYQPNYIFIIRSPFSGFDNKSLVSPVDRYTDVSKWMIRQKRG
ncbi:MAG TPA: peptide ABC transporter substrate-binding protein [Candidatus Saccharimonadales bacterium]|nr:peptide ABC transporter substrate-binding protein [Candidatus Saccharimonadales bacterium]